MKRAGFALSLAAALAGCSRSEPEPEATDAAVERPAPPPASPPPAARPSPTVEPSADANAAVADLPPPAEVGADEQMLDDASATGMTARARRDAEEATEETAPVNSEEQ